MSVLIFHWLVCMIREKMKLKRFYDHVNRPFDWSLASGCQRSIPSLQIVHVLSRIAMIAMKTHHTGLHKTRHISDGTFTERTAHLRTGHPTTVPHPTSQLLLDEHCTSPP